MLIRLVAQSYCREHECFSIGQANGVIETNALFAISTEGTPALREILCHILEETLSSQFRLMSNNTDIMVVTG